MYLDFVFQGHVCLIQLVDEGIPLVLLFGTTYCNTISYITRGKVLPYLGKVRAVCFKNINKEVFAFLQAFYFEHAQWQ